MSIKLPKPTLVSVVALRGSFSVGASWLKRFVLIELFPTRLNLEIRNGTRSGIK